MEKGYVYIGRLVDHKGNFNTDYRKLGKSIDFKTREVSLNSTHLPLDVLFVRVFETDHMSSLEKVLHACFTEYRVTKEYDYRRNITTEWFDVDDDELFDKKINEVIKYFPKTSEVDLIQKITSDTGTTLTQKVEMINVVKKDKASSVITLTYKGQDFTQETAKLTMAKAYEIAANKVGWETIDKDEEYLSNNPQEFYDKYTNLKAYMVIKLGDYHLYTNLDNKTKYKCIQRLCERYELTDLVCEYTDL
jgi:hypothetical protein